MKKIIYTMLAAAAIGFTSCNDSFMERYPDTSLTEQTVFSTKRSFMRDMGLPELLLLLKLQLTAEIVQHQMSVTFLINTVETSEHQDVFRICLTTRAL